MDALSFRHATSGASPVLGEIYNNKDVPFVSKSGDTSAQDILKQIGNHQFMQSDCPEYTAEQHRLIQQHQDEKDDEYARLIQDEADEENEIDIQKQKDNLMRE